MAMDSRIKIVNVQPANDLSDRNKITVDFDLFACGGRATVHFTNVNQGDRARNVEAALADLRKWIEELTDALQHGRIEDRNAGVP